RKVASRARTVKLDSLVRTRYSRDQGHGDRGGRHPRAPSGHAVHARSARAGARPPPRICDRAPHQGHLLQRAGDRGRLPLSRAQPHAGQGLAEGRVGSLGEQPAGAVLPADGRRPQAARARSEAVREAGDGHPARDADGMSGPSNRLMALWRRLTHLGRASSFDRELDEEIALHIEMRADELQQEGMAREDALARARREFGSALRVKEETRAAWQFRWFEETLSDLSYAARALRRDPGFAAAGVLSLALGIGANTTIFSLTMEFLFSEPSSRNPETLAAMRVGGNSHARMRHYRFLRDARIFPGLAGSNEEAESNWRHRDETYRLHAMRVTDNFFGVVGVPLAMGRPIEPGDGDVAVLSDRFWRTRLGAEADVIGKALTIDGRPYTVSGVLPPDHRTVLGFGFSPDVYLPASRESDVVALVARLPDGMSLPEAHGRLVAACKELDKVYPPDWNPQASWVTNTDIVPVAGMARLRHLS